MSALAIESSGEEHAEGGDLVLVHGWGIGKSAWNDLLPLLAPHFRVHRVTLPGYGSARPLVDAPDFLATAAALVDTLPAGCTLCGWSLGGLLALQAAAQLSTRSPQHIARLVLCATTPSFRQRPDWPHAQTPALLDGFRQAVANDASGTLQRFIALLNQGDRKARANTRTLGRAAAADELANQQADAATLVRGLDWLGAVDLRAQLATITLPTLIIHGEEDLLMPLAAARWLDQTLPQSRLEILGGAAHAPFVNDPERFAQLIFDFCHVPAPH